MKLFNAAVTIGGLALLGAMAAPDIRADAWNRKTVITFSGPVEIPGVHLPGWGILPAGTYVFKILDSQANRHVVQIFNKEETKVYATILAIPNFRLKATDKTVITFRERPAGQPEALRAWFYPGRNWGEEFVYSKKKAMELAKATNTNVLFTPDELPVEVSEEVKSFDAPVVVELNKAPVMAITPAGEVVQIAEAVTPLPAEEAQGDPIEVAKTEVAKPEIVTAEVAKPEVATTQVAKSEVATTLPSTASSLGLLLLTGLLALVGAIALKSPHVEVR